MLLVRAELTGSGLVFCQSYIWRLSGVSILEGQSNAIMRVCYEVWSTIWSACGEMGGL